MLFRSNTVFGKVSYPYSTSFKDMNVQRGPQGDVPSGVADSWVRKLRLDAATNLVSYEMKVDATVFPEFFGSGVSATAQAADPQVIDQAGFFVQTIGLRAGTGLFVSSSGLEEGSAAATFELTADGILPDPMASITLKYDLAGTDVAVAFNSDPRLQFFEPDASIPLSAGSVRSLLLSRSELFTEAGLTSDLPLFTVSLDLSDSILPAGAALGSQLIGSVNAVPVPEATSFSLAGLCLLIFFARSRRWRVWASARTASAE